MKTLLVFGIIAILVIAGVSVVLANTSQEKSDLNTETVECSSCGNSCSGQRNCGLSTCGAVSGGSCGCGR